MNITADRSIVMDLKQERVNGREGLGIYQLYFTFNYILRSWKDKHFTARNAWLVVHLKESRRKNYYIGTARPKKPFNHRTPTPERGSVDGQLTFVLDLTHHQIEEIEEMRNGHDLQFETTLQSEVITQDTVNNKQYTTTSESELRVNVNQSAWLKALQQMGYGDYLLFEIPIPENNTDVPEKILNHLSSARDHINKGHYDVTIQKCRFIFDRMKEFLKDKKAIGKANDMFCQGGRKDMGKRERTNLIRNTIHHFTHLAHHPHEDNEGNDITFTRQDAVLILSQTASLVSYYFGK
jgi:hypothetical protein